MVSRFFSDNWVSIVTGFGDNLEFLKTYDQLLKDRITRYFAKFKVME